MRNILYGLSPFRPQPFDSRVNALKRKAKSPIGGEGLSYATRPLKIVKQRKKRKV
jgi:hypothetical protein